MVGEVCLFIFCGLVFCLFDFEIFPQNHSCLYFFAVVERSTLFSQARQKMSTLFLKNFVTFLLRPRTATLQPKF
jgi:hypothetical protein